MLDGKKVISDKIAFQSAVVVVAIPVKVMVSGPGVTKVAIGTTEAVTPPGNMEGNWKVSPTRPSVSVTTSSTILSSTSVRVTSVSTIFIAGLFSIYVSSKFASEVVESSSSRSNIGASETPVRIISTVAVSVPPLPSLIS